MNFSRNLRGDITVKKITLDIVNVSVMYFTLITVDGFEVGALSASSEHLAWKKQLPISMWHVEVTKCSKYGIFAYDMRFCWVLPKSASYPVWLINHVGLGLLAPNYAFVFGPFFFEACIFFGLTLGSMSIGALSSFTESESFQPNRLWDFYVGGAAMSCFVNYIMYPFNLFLENFFEKTSRFSLYSFQFSLNRL